MNALVLDGAERASLAVTRSLGMKGIRVTVAESYSCSTSSLSKYCKNRVVYSSPEKDAARFLEDLLSLVKTGKYQIIYPLRETTNILLSMHKKEFEKYVIVPIPDYDKLLVTCDKFKTLELALKNNVPCPETYLVNKADELPQDVAFPLVVKPRLKTVIVKNKPVMLKVVSRNYVTNRDELRLVFDEIVNRCGIAPLVQEFVPGEGYGVEALCHFGEPRAVFVHHRLREYPITGGASTFREGVHEPQMMQFALAILQQLKWHGVAMVEFKMDKRDNKPKLMEINGRFWGSLALPVASGVDFPFLLNKMMIDGDVEPVMNYKTGVKCRWFIPGEMLWLAASLRKGNRFNTLKEFVRYPFARDDIISLSDILPTFGAVMYLFKQAKSVIRGKRNIYGEITNKC